MIERGVAWEEDAPGGADATVRGGDADLAAAIAAWPPGDDPPTFAFVADESSALARTVGLTPGRAPSGAGRVTMDALSVRVDRSRTRSLAVNAVVVGVTPARLAWWHRAFPTRIRVEGQPERDAVAVGVVVANGQFVDGLDLVPRGHPGDGVLEVQIFGRFPRAQVRELRRRAVTGAHVPHPQIAQRRAASVAVETTRRAVVTVDGVRHGRAGLVEVSVLPGAFRLLL